jgi:hypothetical protein
MKGNVKKGAVVRVCLEVLLFSFALFLMSPLPGAYGYTSSGTISSDEIWPKSSGDDHPCGFGSD